MGVNQRKAVRERRKRAFKRKREFAKKVADRLLGNPVPLKFPVWHYGTTPPGGTDASNRQ